MRGHTLFVYNWEEGAGGISLEKFTFSHTLFSLHCRKKKKNSAEGRRSFVSVHNNTRLLVASHQRASVGRIYILANRRPCCAARHFPTSLQRALFALYRVQGRSSEMVDTQTPPLPQ